MTFAEHERMVDSIAQRLADDGFTDVRTRVEYGGCGKHGECDVLAHYKGFTVYVEVKSSSHPHAILKAQKQLDRFRYAHHHDPNIRTLIYTPKGIQKYNPPPPK